MYIEWFLLDNTLMNALVLSTACALLAKRPKPLPLLAAAFAGGLIAWLALTAVPFLLNPIGKACTALLMTIPLCHTKKEFFRSFFALLGSAMLIGGCVSLVTLFLGGTMQNGILLAVPPLRFLLYGAAAASFLPRLIRSWQRKRIAKHYLYPLRITLNGAVHCVQAFLDTGNALHDPVSQVPVILVSGISLPRESIPVPCETATGSGLLHAMKPEKLELFIGEWREIHALIAASPVKIRHADALIGPAAFPYIHQNEKESDAHETTAGP